MKAWEGPPWVVSCSVIPGGGQQRALALWAQIGFFVCVWSHSISLL